MMEYCIWDNYGNLLKVCATEDAADLWIEDRDLDELHRSQLANDVNIVVTDYR